MSVLGTSFIMAARNAEKTIADSIRSVLEINTRGPLELVVVDDASEDGTYDAVREFAGAVTSIRLSQRAGRSQARHEAILLSRHDYVAIQDADDISLPDRLEASKDCIDGDHQAAGGQMEYVSSTGKVWDRSSWPSAPEDVQARLQAFNVPVPHPTLIFSRELYNAAGGYDGRFTYAEDLHLMVRMSRFTRFRMTDERLVRYTRPPRDRLAYLLRTERGRAEVIDDLDPAKSPSAAQVLLRTSQQYGRQAYAHLKRRTWG